MNTYELNGFCGRSDKKSPMVTVFPCLYRIERNGEDIDITIIEYRGGRGGQILMFIFYSGDPIPLLAMRISKQFHEQYNVVPGEENIQKLLKAINYYDIV
jgi:hypothetical protein